MNQRHRQLPPVIRVRRGLRGFRGLALHQLPSWSTIGRVAGEPATPPGTPDRRRSPELGADPLPARSPDRLVRTAIVRPAVPRSPIPLRDVVHVVCRSRAAQAQVWSMTKWGTLLVLGAVLAYAILGWSGSSALGWV